MFKKNIIKPGQVTREISGWEEVAGVKYPVRKMAVKRVSPPKTEFTDRDQVRMDSLKEFIESPRFNKILSSDTLEKSREEDRQKKLDELAALEKKRTKLTRWEDEQIFRCIHGHGGMTGKHYFYFHFGWIYHTRNQMKVPDQPKYRACDNWAFRVIQKAEETKTGGAFVKKRRWGFTWILVNDTVYDLTFKDGNIFFVTKDEADRDKFYSRVDFMIDRLPEFLKKPRVRDAIELKTFAASERIAKVRGIDHKIVPEAVLRCASPRTIAAVEGGTCTKFVLDEAGKMPNLEKVLSMGIPMLADEDGIDRDGCLLVGGTVGEMNTSGRKFKNVFTSPRTWDVIPVFIPGWMGYQADKLGNENKEKALAKIHDMRDAAESEGNLTRLNELKQQYPLTLDDAFSSNMTDSLLPAHLIERADLNNQENRPKVRYGMFAQNHKGDVEFIEQAPVPAVEGKSYIGQGQVQILEEPIRETLFRNPYVVGADPVDYEKDKYKESDTGGRNILSDQSFVVIRRTASIGEEFSVVPVCIYYGRPDDNEDAYLQGYLMAKFYGAKINLERNRGTAMKKFGEENGFGDLIAYGAGVALEMGGSDSRRWGFNLTETWWNTMIPIGKKWLNKNYMCPMVQRFIDEMYVLRKKNTDVWSAFLAGLQLAREYDIREARGLDEMKDNNKRSISPLWVKDSRGVFQPRKSNALAIQQLKQRQQLRKLRQYG